MGKYNPPDSFANDVASGWFPEDLTEDQIADGDSYHSALYHDGDTMRPASWHRDSIKWLLESALPVIKEGDLVVDYGSGTGGSAIELLKLMDERGVSIELVLIDPLKSWFGKAWEVLGHRDNVHFEHSIVTGENGKPVFRRLDEMLSGKKANVIISSSTMHLVPTRALPDLAFQFAESLESGGFFFWNSGDLECDWRDSSVARLHDPFRRVREFLRKDKKRMEILDGMNLEDANTTERRIDRIFPVPYPINWITDSLEEAGFNGELSERIVDFRIEDAERFILVPRLAEIAAPLFEGEERDMVIRETLEIVFARMRGEGTATDNGYRSHWVYGIHEKN